MPARPVEHGLGTEALAVIAAYVSAAFYETVAARHDADLVINAERTSPPDSAATSMEALRIGQHRESV